LPRFALQNVQRAINQLPLGLGATTRRAACGLLRRVFNQAVEWDMIERNPFRGVKVPKALRHEHPFWTEKEAAMFLTAAKSTRHYATFYVALATGLRIGELLALTWDDVDLKKGCLDVSKTLLSSRNGKPVTGPPKTESSNRKVFLDPSTVEVLKAHRAAQIEQRLRTQNWQSHNLIFCRQDGGAENYSKYNYILRRQKQVLPISVHSLRHTHATFLLNKGISEIVIADRLGHTVKKNLLGISITMTARYTHVTDDMRKKAALAFVRALQKGFLEYSGQVEKVGQSD